MVLRDDVVNELRRRRDARNHFIDFVRYAMPNFDEAPHHSAICDALERVFYGETKRLMVFAPPRHGKSQLVSRFFPAWCLAMRDRLQLIVAGYSKDFVTELGHDIRDILGSDPYHALFPDCKLNKDSRSKAKFRTTNGGMLYASGVEGSITGRGAHIGIIDDPIKDRKRAESKRTREETKKWFNSAFYTRLMQGGAIVIVLTRWHDDDLAGSLLRENPDAWEVLSFPAVAENGDALWPSHFPREKLDEIRQIIGPVEFNCLYQQSPVTEGGGFFQIGAISRFSPSEIPDGLETFITCDFAVSTGSGDYTVLAVFGYAKDGRLFLIDHWRDRTSADIWINRLFDMYQSYGPSAIYIEKGQIARAVEPMIADKKRTSGVYPNIQYIAPTRDKEGRARAAQDIVSRGNFSVPYGKVGDDTLDEMAKFPVGQHDDIVDCISLAANVRRPHDVMYDILKQPITTSWKTF